jgi:hypothetical protein
MFGQILLLFIGQGSRPLLPIAWLEEFVNSTPAYFTVDQSYVLGIIKTLYTANQSTLIIGQLYSTLDHLWLQK